MSSPTGVKLGVRIRRLRKAKGYESIEAFARDLGYSWITVSRYERGKSTPDLTRLHHIADVLGVSIAELVSDEVAA
jgi:transcriptional regulator with XRE-family HTH domain